MTRVPADQAVRERAARAIDESFVVEAGAGTGKTRLLVSRLLALVEAGRPLERIVAITFTEKAASEMKLRLRDALARLRGTPWADAALRAVEVAPITTIHAFASGLLRRFPVEARVDPAFAVADEARATGLRDAAWQSYLAEVLDEAPPALERALLVDLPAARVEPVLRELAFALASTQARAPTVPDTDLSVAALERAGALLVRVLALAEARAVPAEDGLVAEARRLHREIQACGVAKGAEREALLLRLQPWKKSCKGSRPRWRDVAVLESARALAREADAARAEARATVCHAIAAGFVEVALGFREAYRRAKVDASVLDFDDLLVCARCLLASDPAVRARVAADFDAIVVDEFQDTDPVQAEIVRHLAAGDRDRAAPGRLFVVGDPKQSIYAFRGADIAEYARFRDRLRAEGGTVASIHESFRPVRPLLDLANELSAQLLPAVATPLQPAAAPLTGGDEPAEPRPSVIVLAPEPSAGEPSQAEQARDDGPAVVPEDPSEVLPPAPAEREAAAVARLVRRALDEGWQIRDRALGPRPIRAGDVAILLPAMTAPLEAYEEALQAEGIPHVVSGGKRFYRSIEVTALLAAVSAIDDPGNRLALVAALRSPLFGASDDAIVRRAAGPHGLTILDPGGDDEVASALRILSDLHRDRDRVGAARTLGALLDRTGSLGAFSLKPHGHQRVQNLLKLVDEARRLAEADGMSFRRLARMLAERLEGQHAAAQAPAAEAGQEAVEILTVHKSKGLEFGLVVLGALGHVPAQDRAHVLVQAEVAEAAVVGHPVRFETRGFEPARLQAQERRAAEGRRLLYVALTRARDYLVLPLATATPKSGSALEVLTRCVPELASLAQGAVRDRIGTVPILLERIGEQPAPSAVLRTLGAAEVLAAVPLASSDPFWAEREALLRRASVGLVHRAPSREEEADPDAARQDEDDALAASFAARRRAGAGVGTVVHLALESADLASPKGAAALARAHARARGLGVAEADRAAVLVQAALASAALARARAAPRLWRELPFTLAIEGGVLSGSVDLCFESESGLVLVDYKTDAVPAGAVETRLRAHRRQLAEYALALGELTGRPVREAIVLFLSAAVERSVAITPALLTEARAGLGRASPQRTLF